MPPPIDLGQLSYLLSYKEVAEIMGVSKATVRRLVMAEAMPLPVCLTPRTVRFYSSEISDFVRNQWARPHGTAEPKKS